MWALATTLWTFPSGRSLPEDPVGDNSASVAARVYEGIRGLSRPDALGNLSAFCATRWQLDPWKRTGPQRLNWAVSFEIFRPLMGRLVTAMSCVTVIP